MNNEIELEMISVDQLLTLTNWRSYSLNNILEIANKGYIGMYVQIRGIKKRTYNVNESLNHLINASSISTIEKTYYQSLDDKLMSFKAQYPRLLQSKRGYERLATQLESEVFQLSYTGAISRLIEDKQIPFFEFNNTFGFFEDNDTLFACSYLLKFMGNWLLSPPKNYKGCYSTEDLFVCVKDIASFETEKKIIIPMFAGGEDETVKKYEIKIQGKQFKAKYKGVDILIPVNKGLKYIDYLLKNRGQEIPCLLLTQLFTKQKSLSFDTSKENLSELENQGISGDLLAGTNYHSKLDEQALQEYKQRIKKIDGDIFIAKETGDITELTKLEDEKSFIAHEIAAATNNKGRLREFNNPQDNARKAVSKAIYRALNDIKEVNQSFYEHLIAYLKISAICSYSPIEKILWV